MVDDLLHTNRYHVHLRELGLTDMSRRNLGWHMWWGGPFLPTRLVNGFSET